MADNLQHKDLNSLFTDIANSIRQKSGISVPIVADDFPTAISNIPSGGGSSTAAGVKFIDYDGALIDFWFASDVASKTALPDNPTGHTRLVADGWNWTLTKIKTYMANYPNAMVTVGQMYHTVSGMTEFDITVTKVTGLTVICNIEGTKDWGDGTGTDKSSSHTYTNYGNYTIKCTVGTIPNVFSASSTNMNRFWCTAAYIASDVTHIGDDTFRDCSNLKSITIPNSVKSISYDVFSGCSSLTSVTIPSSVMSIGNAFEGCSSLTSITIPDSVTFISSDVFSYCSSLTNITIPDSMTGIPPAAFKDCISLTSITIPNSVTSIGQWAFEGCSSLHSLTIPNSVTSIGFYAFQNCSSLTNITIPNSVTSISYGAFSGCSSLTSITIPYGVTGIGMGMFNECSSLTSVTIPDSVKYIYNGAFNGCSSLTSITIPYGVTEISVSAFGYCYNLTNVTIPDSVTSIGQQVFYNCSGLKSITIPPSVTSIGQGTFYKCYSIIKYDFSSATKVPTLGGSSVFDSINGLCKIVVPDALYSSWKTATNWSTYADYIYKVSEVTD